ncbi:MmgE/PrpD family protein [Nocardia coffeae]|uniref:MmgE/PrpD family protein n=1 Tax=Nocardia coffeae TaxID=2873381 RepID=UPI001F1E944B|nr:MmgE/PrpD family protein [Nocardia coffeae]
MTASAGDDRTVEERLADHLATTGPADIPKATAAEAARGILWWTATALESAAGPQQEALRSLARRHGGPPEATVLGSELRAPAELAGLINGRAGKAGEHEDKFWADGLIGFAVGCCVVPAAVAMAQVRGNVSGRELITAVALAIDAAGRLFSPLGMGFLAGRTTANATFALGNYGAAVAAGKILGLDASAFLNALGIAHNQAGGNYQAQYEGRGVSIQAGFSVRNGVTAARMAAAGVHGPRGSISGKAGLYAVHYPQSEVDLQVITKGLGADYLGRKVGYKAYPCGVVAHAAVEVVCGLRERIAGRAIEAVEVRGPYSLAIMVEPVEAKQAPRTPTEAQFSLPWAVACALRDGDLTIDHYSAGAVLDEQLRALAGRVKPVIVDGLEGTEVRVALADGEVIESELSVARGHPDNPLSNAEITALFLKSAERTAVDSAQATAALGMLETLADQTDVDQIFSRLTGPLPG